VAENHTRLDLSNRRFHPRGIITEGAGITFMNSLPDLPGTAMAYCTRAVLRQDVGRVVSGSPGPARIWLLSSQPVPELSACTFPSLAVESTTKRATEVEFSARVMCGGDGL
jgi:hypothetical protein